jgi:hypothetical protein
MISCEPSVLNCHPTAWTTIPSPIRSLDQHPDHPPLQKRPAGAYVEGPIPHSSNPSTPRRFSWGSGHRRSGWFLVGSPCNDLRVSRSVRSGVNCLNLKGMREMGNEGKRKEDTGKEMTIPRNRSKHFKTARSKRSSYLASERVAISTYPPKSPQYPMPNASKFARVRRRTDQRPNLPQPNPDLFPPYRTQS